MFANVYDLVFPSPVSLEETASATVAETLWRQKVDTFRLDPETNIRGRITIKTISSNLRITGADNFDQWTTISVRSMLPNLPSVIVNRIERYAKCIESSVIEWLKYHFKRVFTSHINYYDILNDFDQLACDYDCSINYDRTAKRMILSKQIGDVEKFKIACLYCFEDDVIRLWPRVSSNIGPKECKLSYMHYWMRRLRLESNSTRSLHHRITQADVLIRGTVANSSLIDYFWNVTPEEERHSACDYLASEHPKIFARYILQRLDEEDLSKILGDYSIWIICELLKVVDGRYAIAAWMFIRNELDESKFGELFNNIFGSENVGEDGVTEDVVSVVCELWKNTSDNLKRSMIKRVLSNANDAANKWYSHVSNSDLDFFFDDDSVDDVYYIASANVCKPLFFVILADATLEERSKFWYENWQDCVLNYEENDMNELMNLCLGNANEVSKFKMNMWGKYENIAKFCSDLLEKARFEKLNNFLKLCNLEKQTIGNFKQRLLARSSILLKKRRLSMQFITEAQSLNAFVNSAYNSVSLATKFKNRLLSSSSTIQELLLLVNNFQFFRVTNFVDTFASSETITRLLKERFINTLKQSLFKGCFYSFNAEEFQNFLMWCLINEENIQKFKEGLSVHEMVLNWIQILKSRSLAPVKLTTAQDEFLKWYFITSKEAENFKKNFIPECGL